MSNSIIFPLESFRQNTRVGFVDAGNMTQLPTESLDSFKTRRQDEARQIAERLHAHMQLQVGLSVSYLISRLLNDDPNDLGIYVAYGYDDQKRGKPFDASDILAFAVLEKNPPVFTGPLEPQVDIDSVDVWATQLGVTNGIDIWEDESSYKGSRKSLPAQDRIPYQLAVTAVTATAMERLGGQTVGAVVYDLDSRRRTYLMDGLGLDLHGEWGAGWRRPPDQPRQPIGIESLSPNIDPTASGVLIGVASDIGRRAIEIHHQIQ